MFELFDLSYENTHSPFQRHFGGASGAGPGQVESGGAAGQRHSALAIQTRLRLVTHECIE